MFPIFPSAFDKFFIASYLCIYFILVLLVYFVKVVFSDFYEFASSSH